MDLRREIFLLKISSYFRKISITRGHCETETQKKIEKGKDHIKIKLQITSNNSPNCRKTRQDWNIGKPFHKTDFCSRPLQVCNSFLLPNVWLGTMVTTKEPPTFPSVQSKRRPTHTRDDTNLHFAPQQKIIKIPQKPISYSLTLDEYFVPLTLSTHPKNFFSR